MSALRTFRGLLGTSHTKVALVLNKLAILCLESGTLDDISLAAEYAAQAQSIFEQRGGGDVASV